MLELVEVSPSSTYEVLFSSITSTELRKITFLVGHMDHWRNFVRKQGEWVPIDKQLCQVVDRLRTTGYNRILVVELRLTKVGSDAAKYSFPKFLPMFREKGVVLVTASGD